MADFETWKFDSLVQFAQEAQARIAVLEIKLNENNSTSLYTRITELEGALREAQETLAECDKDRKDLLNAMRDLYKKELRNDT